MPGSDDSDYEMGKRYRYRLYGDLLDGAIAGLLGGGSIMVLTLLYDALLFKPLVTPNFLAQTLLGREGVAVDGTAQAKLVQIGMFTVLHLAAFVFLGIVLVKIFRITGIRNTLLFGGLYGFTVCTSLFGVSLQLSGAEVSLEPKRLVLLLVNFIAGVVMAGYLQARTPRRKGEQQ